MSGATQLLMWCSHNSTYCPPDGLSDDPGLIVRHSAVETDGLRLRTVGRTVRVMFRRTDHGLSVGRPVARSVGHIRHTRLSKTRIVRYKWLVQYLRPSVGHFGCLNSIRTTVRRPSDQLCKLTSQPNNYSKQGALPLSSCPAPFLQKSSIKLQ